MVETAFEHKLFEMISLSKAYKALTLNYCLYFDFSHSFTKCSLGQSI